MKECEEIGMRKNYKRPIINTIELDMLDIITTSGMMDKGPLRNTVETTSAGEGGSYSKAKSTAAGWTFWDDSE